MIRPAPPLLAVGLVLAACGAQEVTSLGVASGGATPSEEVTDPLPRQGSGRARNRQTGSGKPVTFAFGGDVNFEGPLDAALANNGDTLLEMLQGPLGSADIAMVNLETAITERGTPSAKQFNFRAPPGALNALGAAGVDVVTIANNHGVDFGEQGLFDTLDAGAERGLPMVGGGRDEVEAYTPFLTTIKGQRIAVFGATQVLDSNLIAAWTAGPDKPGIANAKDPEPLVAAIEAIRPEADTVVVFLHWGIELEQCATVAQRELAEVLSAAGADIIVGGHAHVLEAGGMRGGAYVHYGLGNFVFGSAGGRTAETGVLQLTATGRRIDAAQWQPGRISGGLPGLFPAGPEADAAVSSWEALRQCADVVAGVENGP